MKFYDTKSELSLLTKISFSAALVFHFISYITPFWNDYSDDKAMTDAKIYHLGLWEYCRSGISISDICHGFQAKRLFMILSYVCFSLGFIFQCVGLWTPYWNDYSNTDMVYHKGVYNLGLWQSCYGRGNDTICSQFSVKGGVPAARLFQTLAFLTFIAIIVILILHRIRGQTRFLFIASLGCAITAVLIIIGVLSWVFSSTYLQYNLSWSFGLCILGALFCLLTSMLLAKERLNLLIIKSKRKVSTAEAMLSSTEKLDQPN